MEEAGHPGSQRQILWAAVVAAQAEHQDAEAAFDGLVKQVPTGIPALYMSLQIKRSGAARHLALQNYMRVLREFTQHVIGKDA